MRSGRKVAIALLGVAIWLGAVAVQRTDLPVSSLASVALNAGPSSSPQRAGTDSASLRGGASPTGPVLASPPTPASAAGPVTPTAAGANGPSAAPASPPPAAATAKTPSSTAFSDAGGSMSPASPASQVYAQTTQAGWGCQAALEYLAQHANPKFSVVCPGYAMGHQAMTCLNQPGMCPDSAEIVIADPCPAAYQNEAWNSWHIGTGPFDPYGWCSDWNNRRGPSQSIPLLTANGPEPGNAPING